jgi:hypothetical protein
VRVIGEAAGLGKSRIVALAFAAADPMDPQGATFTALGAVLVVPSRRHGTGWAAQSSETLRGISPSAGAVVLGQLCFCGVWLVLGTLADDRAAAVRVRVLGGPEQAPEVRYRGFLLAAEEEPLPMHVRVLASDGQVIDEFHHGQR